MSDSIGIISSTVGATNAPVVAAPATSQTPSAPVTPTVTASASTPLVHNPRIFQDPKAGFITEYLNANGTQVISQSPSAAAVAYLRLGLAADGLPKAENSPATTTTA